MPLGSIPCVEPWAGLGLPRYMESLPLLSVAVSHIPAAPWLPLLMFQLTPLRLMVSTDLLAPKRFWLGRGGEQDLLVPEEAWAVAPASVNHGNDILLGWLSALWGLCRAQRGYCYMGQCLPETVWEGRGSLCCNHPAIFFHLPSLLSQQCRKCSPPWRNLSISSGPGKEAPSPYFLVQNTWTPSCRWPSSTSQTPLIRAFLVCGQLLGAKLTVVFLWISWLQHWQEHLLGMLMADVCSRAWGVWDGCYSGV